MIKRFIREDAQGASSLTPLFVYGNWAAYDELSDGIPLTEELAMRQLQELLRLRRSGVTFDAYLMDAFWFAPDGGYRTWRTPNWPKGPDRWLEACREHGLLPGMWFTANTLCHLSPTPAWQDSIDEKGWGMCLFEGGFLADFLDVLHGWYERGIRLFKFDFAEFNAVPRGWSGDLSPAEIRALNVAKFREAMMGFRVDHREAVLLGYNGFEDRECMERTDRPFARFIDPAWLEVFDTLYAGDPRPADVPSLSFWRSVDIYSDHMTRLFEASGIPLDRIENCGFMAGNTGTCYWRGARDWQQMLLLSLARGGRIHVAYGDLSLLSDRDAMWWARAQELYRGSMTAGGTEAFGGIPGRGEPYGWLSRGGEVALATVVNPGISPAELNLPSAFDWQLVGQDGKEEPRVMEGSVRLSGGQMAVLSSPAIQPLRISKYVKINPGHLSAQEIPVASRTDDTIAFRLDAGSHWERRLLLQQFDADGNVFRSYPTDERPRPFIVSDQNGTRYKRFPGMRVWSGLSWMSTVMGPSTESLDVTVECPGIGTRIVRAWVIE